MDRHLHNAHGDDIQRSSHGGHMAAVAELIETQSHEGVSI